MTYWLIANPEAGDGKRGREYWLNMLQSAGAVTWAISAG